MHPALAGLLLVFGLFFAHWRFVDMWFAGRGGLKWFWRTRSASAPLRMARLTFAMTLAAVVSAVAIRTGEIMVLACLLLFVNMGLMLYVSERPR